MENNQIMSDSIDQLATALAKAQLEFKVAIKNSKNPFFKSTYADFESLKEATVPALGKYGLSVIHPALTTAPDGNSYLVTLLFHASGQWVKSSLIYSPPKSDVQSLSSYNTYIKRMCYSNITGVATSENDDDGEATMQREQPRQSAPVYSPQPNIIRGYEHTVLMNLIAQCGDGYEEAVCEIYGISDLTKLPALKYAEVKNQLESKLVVTK